VSKIVPILAFAIFATIGLSHALGYSLWVAVAIAAAASVPMVVLTVWETRRLKAEAERKGRK
jgi:Flp pilus assembly protein TadB